MSEATAPVAPETKAPAEAKKPVPKPKEVKPTIWSRRDFFTNVGWIWALGGTLLAVLFSLRFLFPRVIYEPPAVFKAGYPEEYPPGSVSDKWQSEFRTVLVRRETGEFYALFMKCTHLGCTPVWLGPENKFKCPCHGSGFTRDGVNYEGPAPRALERFEVTVADDGQLLVNRAKKFLYESGEWENSLLAV